MTITIASDSRQQGPAHRAQGKKHWGTTTITTRTTTTITTIEWITTQNEKLVCHTHAWLQKREDGGPKHGPPNRQYGRECGIVKDNMWYGVPCDTIPLFSPWHDSWPTYVVQDEFIKVGRSHWFLPLRFESHDYGITWGLTWGLALYCMAICFGAMIVNFVPLLRIPVHSLSAAEKVVTQDVGRS